MRKRDVKNLTSGPLPPVGEDLREFLEAAHEEQEQVVGSPPSAALQNVQEIKFSPGLRRLPSSGITYSEAYPASSGGQHRRRS